MINLALLPAMPDRTEERVVGESQRSVGFGGALVRQRERFPTTSLNYR
jgi:hypothetical protein